MKNRHWCSGLSVHKYGHIIIFKICHLLWREIGLVKMYLLIVFIHFFVSHYFNTSLLVIFQIYNTHFYFINRYLQLKSQLKSCLVKDSVATFTLPPSGGFDFYTSKMRARTGRGQAMTIKIWTQNMSSPRRDFSFCTFMSSLFKASKGYITILSIESVHVTDSTSKMKPELLSFVELRTHVGRSWVMVIFRLKLLDGLISHL